MKKSKFKIGQKIKIANDPTEYIISNIIQTTTSLQFSLIQIHQLKTIQMLDNQIELISSATNHIIECQDENIEISIKKLETKDKL